MLAALLPALSAVGVLAASLVRGPYVEGVTARSGWVCWRTDVPTEGVLELRALPEGEPSRLSDRESKRQHCLEAPGLNPGSLNEYRIRWRQRGGPWVSSSTHSFRAAAPAGATIRFAVFGDSGRATKEQFAVAARVIAAKPEFVLHTGDVVYPYGEDHDYDKKYFTPYGPLIDHVPFYFGIGNHDYANLSRDAGKGRDWLREHWFAVHHNPSGTPPERTYYSFDWGPGHFVSVDANEGYPIAAAPPTSPGGDQWTWLDRDLAASTAPWKIVFLHIAVYASGGHASNKLLKRTLAPLFEKHGVDVVFQGHDHGYERTSPITQGRRAEKGPIYIVAGTGGAPVYRRRERNPWTEVFQERHGFVEATLEPNRLSLRAVGDDGAIFDALELKKPR